MLHRTVHLMLQIPLFLPFFSCHISHNFDKIHFYRHHLDNQDSDEEDVDNLFELMLQFDIHKSSRIIKYKHCHLDWEKHIGMLQHTKTFPSHYHMTLPSFNKLVEMLSPISIDVIKSQNLTNNNDPIF